MGNFASKKSFGKVNDFSLPFMNPAEGGRSQEEWKTLEEEKNRALADKKRFAIRLSEVEDVLSKKSDRIRELEISMSDAASKQISLLSEQAALRRELDCALADRKLALRQLEELRMESELLRRDILEAISRQTRPSDGAQNTTSGSLVKEESHADVTLLPSPSSEPMPPPTDSHSAIVSSGHILEKQAASHLQNQTLERLVRQLADKDKINRHLSEHVRRLEDEVTGLKGHLLLVQKETHFMTSSQRISTVGGRFESSTSRGMDQIHNGASTEPSLDSLTSTEIIGQ